MLRTPAGQSLAARVAAQEADRGEDPGSCPECGVHWSAHPNAHDAGIIATPAGQSLAARVAAQEADRGEDPGSCPECGVHWSAHPNAHDAGIIATPAGQSLAARVAALEAAVPEDPWIVGEAVTYCYSCHLRMMDGHSGACRWLAVRGGASVHRDSADV
jgi:hypothetical protein